MLALALLACTEAPTIHRSRPGNPKTDDGEAALIRDTGRPAPEDTDTGDLPPDTGDSGGTEATEGEVCYLGPARDHSVCVPVVTVADAGPDYVYPAPYDGDPQYAAPSRWLDLDAIDPDIQIAPNFTLSEYAASYKGEYAVMQSHFVDVLQALRDAVGGPVTVTSGYRNPAYNESVGGVEYSRHQYGDAADLEADGYSVEELGDLCYDLGADYVGLYEDGHTHCDWRDHPLDPAFY